MIACPICEAKTTVVETRAIGTSTRRRRRCTRLGCDGKVTTIEIVTRSGQGMPVFADGNAVVVSTRQIDRLRKIVAAITGGTP